MNITTYKSYPKRMEDIKERLNQSMDSCDNAGQIASVLKFHAEYLDAINYFDNIRYEEVTDKMIKAYFAKEKKKKYKK